MSNCRRCDSIIKWVSMEDTGRVVCVEPIPDPTGTVAARWVGTRFRGYVISRGRPLEDGYDLYRAHHGECAVRGPAAPSDTPTFRTDPLIGDA